MLLITKELEVLGLIYQKKGYFDIKRSWKCSTIMMPTYKFYQFCLTNNVDQKSFLGEIQTIDYKKDELIFKEPKSYKKNSGKKIRTSNIIDVSKKKKTQQIERMIRDVKRQNKLSENFQARLNITEYEKKCIYKLMGRYDEILDTRCCRVFTDCVESLMFSKYIRYGGRWYCPCQNVPRRYRKHIEFSYDKGET